MKNSMVSKVERYLAHRRSMGYRLRKEGGMLLNFARYADATNHTGPVNSEIAIQWASLPVNGDSSYKARRFEVVRVYAKHQIAWEPNTCIPSRHFFGPAHRRNTPHIYTANQIQTILQRARKLPGRLRADTYLTVFGLLECTGMRISEVQNLKIGDVDLEKGLITISESKFHHTRIIPIHPTVSKRLKEYSKRRNRLFPLSNHFFVTDRGGRIAYSTVRTVFRELTDDLISISRRPRVRLHDLRHSFACGVLVKWQTKKTGGIDIVPVLSRYLGHRRITDTYWYLTATPALLKTATTKFTPPRI